MDPQKENMVFSDGIIDIPVESLTPSLHLIPAPKFSEDCSEATFSFELRNATSAKDTHYSTPYYIRGLPWRIMVIPSHYRNQMVGKSLGLFLQCSADCDSPNWSCMAVAELSLLSFKPDQEPHKRTIKHIFTAKENDWGFSYFMSWSDIENPQKGYLKDDTLIFEAHVIAQAPHGVLWDSKKYTGYVGLTNQGATCYMNSLLQTLFFTNQLRKAVYQMPTECDDASKSVALALQHVFFDLQFASSPVGTRKLTKSFGWDAIDSFMQHDVQEFLRVLLDKIEHKMKGTSVEGTVPSLFEGQMLSYIKCKNVNMTSKRIETFYDIQLSVKGHPSIYDSFKNYIAPEILEGDNKYDAGPEYGLQDADKGVIFVSFPPILHLHLMRFQYDPLTDCSVKFNDRFEFDEELHLDPFLAQKEDTDAVYRLHAVLVHSGDNHNGHYVVYINPVLDGKWYKFDDDVVSSCSRSEAVEHNYGGSDQEMSLNDKQNSNAYMLVYIRVSKILKVLEPIVESDIPSELIERIDEEKRIEVVRNSERTDPAQYVTIQVILEESFEAHKNPGYFNTEHIQHKIFRALKTESVGSFLRTMCESLSVPVQKIRMWPIVPSHQTFRLLYFDFNAEMETALCDIMDNTAIWTLFLEVLKPDITQTINFFDPRHDIFVLTKYYDPNENVLNYVGFTQYPLDTRLIDLANEMKYQLGLTDDVELNVYEELGPSSINKLTNFEDSIEFNMTFSGDDTQGNILIFEKRIVNDRCIRRPTLTDYFRDQMYRIEVTFAEKNKPKDAGFMLELSQRNTYEQMASIVAKNIGGHPNKIQFFKCQNFKDAPGEPLSCSHNRHLQDLLAFNKLGFNNKLFYQKIEIDINDLESKRQFKCNLVSPDYRDEKEIVVYVDKSGKVTDLLSEASMQIQFSGNSTKKLRLVEVVNYKLSPIPDQDMPLENLQWATENNYLHHRALRIEEVAPDELHFESDEMLVPVVHFWKEIYNAFGIPFFIKVKNGELYGDLLTRMQTKLNISEKDWEKYKFIIFTNSRTDSITPDRIVNLNDFRVDENQADGPLPYIGLEHVNKSHKRPFNSSLEKSFKIYN